MTTQGSKYYLPKAEGFNPLTDNKTKSIINYMIELVVKKMFCPKTKITHKQHKTYHI